MGLAFHQCMCGRQVELLPPRLTRRAANDQEEIKRLMALPLTSYSNFPLSGSKKSRLLVQYHS